MTPEELKGIEDRINKTSWELTVNGLFNKADCDFVMYGKRGLQKLLDYIKELESQIPRWTPITIAVPDEYEIVLFKMVELVALKGEEKPIKGSDPIPDIFEAFPETIETRTSYFTGYRMDKIYRDHLHNCVRNYVRLEWVRIFKEEE